MSDNILFINSCARPDSRTCELARHLLNKMNGELTEINLYEEKIIPLDCDGLKKRYHKICFQLIMTILFNTK